MIPALSNIKVGAELKYGFGCLKLKGEPTEIATINKLFDEYSWSCADEIRITIKENSPLPAHLDMNNMDENILFSGDFEPLVSSGWHKGKYGKKYLGTFWVPGTIVGKEMKIDTPAINTNSQGGLVGEE